MKKIYYLLSCFIFSSFVGHAQCTPDTTNTTFGFSPADTSQAVIIQGTAYSASVQFYSAPVISDSTDTIQVLSTIIDSAITGWPRGINYVKNPLATTVSSGGRFCIQYSGTTNSAAGQYNLRFSGSVHIISQTLGDTILTLASFNSLVQSHGLPAPYAYRLWVIITPVAPCNGLDSNNLTGPGVKPVASDLPCIVQSVPYFQTVQGRIQTDSTVTISVPVVGNLPVVFTVDSVRIDSILGLPNGITFGLSPRTILGGGKGCVSFYGTTTDAVGNYPITAIGTAWLTGNAAGQTIPYTRRGNLNQYAPFSGYYLRVVSTPDSCHLYIDSVTSVTNYNQSLNAKINVFPNPTAGVFTLQVNSGSPVTGMVFIFDALGRRVHEQPIDVLGPYSTTIDISKFGAGLYTLQVSTPQGSAVQKISVE